jgi:hypothetical protein
MLISTGWESLRALQIYYSLREIEGNFVSGKKSQANKILPFAYKQVFVSPSHTISGKVANEWA